MEPGGGNQLDELVGFGIWDLGSGIIYFFKGWVTFFLKI